MWRTHVSWAGQGTASSPRAHVRCATAAGGGAMSTACGSHAPREESDNGKGYPPGSRCHHAERDGHKLGDPFAAAEAISRAVLYEGYLLYPYRTSALKNRQRWMFGRLLPREWCVAHGESETWRMQIECLLSGS